MKRWLVLSLLAGCSFSSKLGMPGAAGGTSPTTRSYTAADAPPDTRLQAAGSGTATMPDLTGLTPAQALEAVRRAGFPADKLEEHDQLCWYADGVPMVAQGTVCDQRPAAGQPASTRASVRITIEHDTPTHGGVGSSGEWRLMPEVKGKPLAEARTILARAGFDVARHFQLEEGDCAADTVCDTSPGGGARVVLSRGGRLRVGVAAPASPPQPGQPGQPGQPTQPTQPPAGGQDTYF